MKLDHRRLNYWDAVAEDLGIVIDRNVKISLGVETIEADALIRDFGARNGMLILSTSDMVRVYGERILEAEYGYSVMSSMSFEAYERESTIDMLIDWGWAADGTRMPNWLRARLSDD